MEKLRKSLPPLACLLPFEATARLGSMTKAGDELGLTQAAISRQIRALEENLGVSLFERRNRAVYLTSDGQDFSRVVSAALESIGSYSTQLRGKSNSNEVVLFAELCWGLYWVMPNLSSFYQCNPDIDVRVSVSTEPVGKANEHFDVVLQTSGRDSGVYPLAFTTPTEVFPVCSPHYLEQIQAPLTLSELPNLNLLHHKVDPNDWFDWDSWLTEVGSDLRVGSDGVSYDSYPMIVQATLEGHGVCLGWDHSARQHLASGALVRPFSERLLLPDGLSVYRHPNNEECPKVKRLLKWIESELMRSSLQQL